MTILRLSLLIATALTIGACASSSSARKPTNGSSASKGKDAIKPYGKVITKEAVSDTGVFTVHQIKDKFFYEIPNDQLGKEFLMVTRTAKTPQVGYGGEKSNTVVVRWERKYDKILLRAVSYVNVAEDSLPIARAVKAANFEEVIEAFPIKAYNKDTSNVVIDVTGLFTSDVGILTPNQGVRKQYKITRLDKNRSFIEYARAFPTNIEVENVITFAASSPSQTYGSKTMSFTMHHSMVRLPENPMMPRLADERVGWFTIRQTGLRTRRE